MKAAETVVVDIDRAVIFISQISRDHAAGGRNPGVNSRLLLRSGLYIYYIIGQPIKHFFG